MHERNPPNISNEPRYTDGSAFTNFDTDLSTAKSSILEFNGVLRSGEHGYTKSGQENEDLTTPREATATAVQQDGETAVGNSERLKETARENTQSSPALPSGYLNISADALDSNEQYLQSEPGPSESPTIDRLNSLMETDTTSFFLVDDTMDFPFLSTDMLLWDIGGLIGNGEVQS
ncbi:hypothetical protein FGRMN_4787 [Fusarium graminum]|nr:hypothetical protein FGRMN_4787 [Fusarium graminum]